MELVQDALKAAYDLVLRAKGLTQEDAGSGTAAAEASAGRMKKLLQLEARVRTQYRQQRITPAVTFDSHLADRRRAGEGMKLRASSVLAAACSWWGCKRLIRSKVLLPLRTLMVPPGGTASLAA